ncbi:MAG: acyl-CoA dehydrogenase family protein [Dehalococcoidia bacterium]|nr:acyl-CoA dehydrogenase family protein [Dehalococcoidia bacterium]
MEFHYSESQEATRKLAREFAVREVAPGAAERDRTGQFDYHLYRRIGELGISGMRFPEEFGGTEADFLSWCLALEELGRVDMSLAVTLFVAVSTGHQLVEMGTGEQLREWNEPFIRPVAEARATASAAITEPGAGSDTASIQTTAVLEDGGWVINGTKAFITNGGLQNNVCTVVVALTDRASKEFSSILVPAGTPGYSMMPAYKKLGWRSSDTREMVFEDCRVPAENLVGQRGVGRQYTVAKLFAEARINISSASLGLHTACLEESLNYARERVAFRRPISQFQFVQGMLVDMALEAELSRLLRDKAARAVDEGTIDRTLSSMAKYFCCESSRKAADRAIQVHGGTGFMDECAVSRYYRDIRACTIADGTTEIQKWIIARELGC